MQFIVSQNHLFQMYAVFSMLQTNCLESTILLLFVSQGEFRIFTAGRRLSVNLGRGSQPTQCTPLAALRHLFLIQGVLVAEIQWAGAKTISPKMPMSTTENYCYGFPMQHLWHAKEVLQMCEKIIKSDLHWLPPFVSDIPQG